MDSLIAAAGRALNAGDALKALNYVALRDDPPALALRGVAMAQLGDYARARVLLRKAMRGFGSREPVAHARCRVADAEVALALREDLASSPRALEEAAHLLEARGERANAQHAWSVALRRQLLLGRLDVASAGLATLEAARLPPSQAAMVELAAAELALRMLRTAEAQAALVRARAAADRSGIAALSAEVEHAYSLLAQPAARLSCGGELRMLRLAEVESLLRTPALIVDACRRRVILGDREQSLARRPVLFSLLQVLAEGWPGEVTRGELVARVFRIRDADETHRARLRVEIGRLRRLMAPMADILASPHGFTLVTHGRDVALLAPPIEGERASLLALLADGMAWSTSALALALGESQRTVQRALVELQAAGQVRSIGRTRTQRWLAPPLLGFTTILLLPATLAAG